MGIDKGILSALVDHNSKVRGPHFILSAKYPLHPQNNELQIGHEQLLNHLYSAGYDAHELKSNYGKPFRSVIVYQIDPQTAEDLHNLASKLGQGHSIYSDGNAHEMRFHHGAFEKRSHYGSETAYHETVPLEGCHTLPGGMCHFDHKFDYRSHHLSGQLDKWSKNG